MLKKTFPDSFQRQGDQAFSDGIADFDALALHEDALASIPADLTGEIARPVDLASTGFAASPGSLPTTSAANARGASISVNAGSAPTVTVAQGATVEIAGASAQPVLFAGTTGTLKLDHSLAFTGQVAGMAGSDAIDLADVSFGIQTQVTFLGDTTGGTLTITDGVNTANIALQGNYLSSTWTLSSDGQGGTIVVDPVPANSWQTLKVGAGGYVRNFDIAPDGTMVGRTDTYGAYLWNGTQWVQLVTSASMPAAFLATNNIGVTNQGVYEIQIADSNTQILYMMYDGYIFKSINQGTTWTQTSFAKVSADPNAGYAQYGPKMAIDPNNPNIVYVGTTQNGLFVTRDGGVTWQSVSQVPVSASDITGMLFDPNGGVVGGVTQTIYAESNGSGVYKSTNGGTSWTLLSGGPTTVANATVTAAGIYYAVDGTNLWRYQNGTWAQLPINSTQGAAAVAVNPLNPNEIVVVSPAGYIDISYDAGATWSGALWNTVNVNSTDVPWLQAGNSAPGGNFLNIGGIAFNPLVPNQLIASAGTGVWNANIPTSLAGFSSFVWNDQSLGIEQLVANEIIVPPGGKPVVASWDRPFFYVSDPNSYPTTYGPVASANIVAGWSLDYASSSPSFLVGIADWWGREESGYSTDGGKTWTPFATEIPGAGTNFIGGTIAASTPTNFVWAPADGYAPYYTLNGGVTWNQVVLPGVTDWSIFDFAYYLDKQTVVADRVLANTFYMYYVDAANDSKQGIYKSTNGGQTWSQVSSGQITPFSAYNSELESVPGQAGNLFFTGGIQGGATLTQPTGEAFMRSTDGGATWNAIANVKDVICFGFGAAATPGGYPSIYIVGWVNNVYGVWQSNNNAQSWTQIGTFPNGSLDQIKTISGDPNIYGQVYVGFMGSGYAYLPAAPLGPTVTGVTESPATGDFGAGNTVTLTLNMSSAVTVAGGVPTLTLNDGGTATYVSGSGTSALVFSYTVGAGQDTAALAATTVNLNGATIQDSGGLAASLTLSGLTQTGPQIDTTVPSVASVAASGTGITAGSGALGAGSAVTLTVNLSEAVTVAGGVPTLTLNDGGVATYVGGSGTNALTFSYTVGSGQNTADLAVTAFNLNGATVKDGAGNAANTAGAVTNPSGTLKIDTTSPALASITESPSSGRLKAGRTVTFTLNMSEAVTVAGGTPTLTLNSGGTATYVSGSGTSALTFSYTVASSQNAASLSATAVNLNGATVKDAAGNAASFTLSGLAQAGAQIDTVAPTVASVVASGTGITAGSGNLAVGNIVTLTVNLSEAVTIAGGTPTLTLNDGGVATYTGGSGTNALTFSYTVSSTDKAVSALAVTQVNLPNGATILDPAGNSADLSGALASFTGLQFNPPSSTLGVVASNLTVAHGQSLSASNLFVAQVPTGGAITKYAFWDTGAGGGHFVVNGVAQGTNQEIDVTAAQLAQVTYQPGSGADTLWVKVYDGTQWSSWSNAFTVTAPIDTGPVLTVSNITASLGQTFAGQNLFTYSDPFGDAATQYDVWNLGTGGGHFVLNGVTLAANQHNIITAAQLSQLSYVSSGTDTLWVKANDGTVWGAWSSGFTVTAPVNTGPVLTVSNITGSQGQSFAAQGLFTYSDPMGAAAVKYDVWNSGTGGGHFVLNGVTLAANKDNFITAAELSQLSYVAGSGTDTLWIKANDGSVWGAWSSGFTATGWVNTGPVLTVSNITASHNQAFAGQSLFTYSDPIGAAATQYDVWNSGTGGGHFVLNGVTLASNKDNIITAAQLSQLSYVAGSGTDTLWVKANDGSVWGAWSNGFTVTAPVDTGPVLAPANSTTNSLQGQVFSVSSLFAYSDPFGDAAVKYDVWNSGTGGGHFALNGVTLASNQDNFITAAQLSQLSYVVGSGTDTLWLKANDGTVWGAWSSGFTMSNSSTTIATGGTLELASAYSGTLSFAGATGTLKIDDSSSFNGTIAGQLGLGHFIDLVDITAGSNATVAYSGNNSPGTLTVSDGTHTVHIALLGNYTLANFTVSSDGHGGTMLVDPPISGGQAEDPMDSAINHQVALLSQYMSSEFSSSGFVSDRSSTLSPSETIGVLSQLACSTLGQRSA